MSEETTIGIKIDDDFTSVTSDVARVWFTLGDRPDDAASVAILVRSVGKNNKVQIGFHQYIHDAVRKAVEAACAPGQHLELLTVVDEAGGQETKAAKP